MSSINATLFYGWMYPEDEIPEVLQRDEYKISNGIVVEYCGFYYEDAFVGIGVTTVHGFGCTTIDPSTDLKVPENADKLLQDFCEENGIEYQTPQWHLSISGSI